MAKKQVSIFNLNAPHKKAYGRQTKLLPGLPWATSAEALQPSPRIWILRPSKKMCLFPIFKRMGENSSRRYGMAFCVVKENISARTWTNQRMDKVFIAVKYNVFIAVKFSVTFLSLESYT